MNAGQHQSSRNVFAPLAYRDYRLVLAALSLSLLASGMWIVAMALQAIRLDRSPNALSLVQLYERGAYRFCFRRWVAADRFPQRTIIIAVESACTIVVTSIAVLGFMSDLKAMAAGDGCRRHGRRSCVFSSCL